MVSRQVQRAVESKGVPAAVESPSESGADRTRGSDFRALPFEAQEARLAPSEAGRVRPVQRKDGAASGGAAASSGDPEVATGPRAANVKPLSAGVMAKLQAEHAKKRTTAETACGAVGEGSSAGELRGALTQAAPLLNITLDSTCSDVSRFEDDFSEIQIRLWMDAILPSLRVDPRVLLDGATDAAMTDAAGVLADGYQPLFAKAAQVAQVLPDVEFAEGFREKFKAIIPAAFGGDVSLETLKVLFTASQRRDLLGYFRTGVLPKSLFTGASVGAATVEQRILMSAHMLVNSVTEKRNPKDGKEVEFGGMDKPKALACGHWAQFVWNYAGVNPAQAYGDPDLWEVGATGERSLGGGKIDGGKGANYMGKMGNDLELSEKQADNVKTNNVPATSPYAQRRKPMDESVFQRIKAGDWIYVYNGNAYGEHSEIFLSWAGGQETTYEPRLGKNVTHQWANVYSQGSPERGGESHTEHIGTEYSDTLGTHPVTAQMRPEASSARPRSPETLLPFDRKAAANKNLDNFAALEFDFDKVSEQLRTSVKARFAAPEYGILQGAQKALIQQVIDSSTGSDIQTISTLIALGQRLGHNKIDGILGFSKSDLELLGSGGLAGVKKPKEARPTGRFGFAMDVALQRNSLELDALGVTPTEMGPYVASAAADCAGGVRAADKEEFKRLYEEHKDGTTGPDIAHLLALWQVAKGLGCSGWVSSQYGGFKPVIGAANHKKLTDTVAARKAEVAAREDVAGKTTRRATH